MEFDKESPVYNALSDEAQEILEDLEQEDRDVTLEIIQFFKIGHLLIQTEDLEKDLKKAMLKQVKQ